MRYIVKAICDKSNPIVLKHSTKMEECSLIRNDTLSFYDIWSKVTWNKMPLHTADIQGDVDKLLLKLCLQTRRKHIFFEGDQSLRVGNTNPLVFLGMINCRQLFSTNMLNCLFCGNPSVQAFQGVYENKTTKNLKEVQLIPG